RSLQWHLRAGGGAVHSINSRSDRQSFRQPGFAQAVRETCQILRPPEWEKLLQIGNAEIRHEFTQSRNRLLGFRQSPCERAAGGAYAIRKGVIWPIAHRGFGP